MNASGRFIRFRRDQPPAQVLERFEDSQHEIEALWRRSDEFREICRDYREACSSLLLARETRNGRDREDQLAELLAELEDEMVTLIRRHISDAS